MKYTVMFAYYGYVDVEADSESEAFAKVEGYGKEDIDWSNEFEAIDALQT